MKVYQFLYNSDCCESAAHTVSIHRTKKGAEMAMEFHKNEIKTKWEEEQKEYKTLGLELDTLPWHFDQWWGIQETELLE